MARGSWPEERRAQNHSPCVAARAFHRSDQLKLSNPLEQVRWSTSANSSTSRLLETRQLPRRPASWASSFSSRPSSSWFGCDRDERWGVLSYLGIAFGQGCYVKVEFISLGNARWKCVGNSRLKFGREAHAKSAPLELRRERGRWSCRTAISWASLRQELGCVYCRRYRSVGGVLEAAISSGEK